MLPRIPDRGDNNPHMRSVGSDCHFLVPQNKTAYHPVPPQYSFLLAHGHQRMTGLFVRPAGGLGLPRFKFFILQAKEFLRYERLNLPEVSIEQPAFTAVLVFLSCLRQVYSRRISVIPLRDKMGETLFHPYKRTLSFGL